MRKLIVSILFLCGIGATAQTTSEYYNTLSPYSIFGVGQRTFRGTAETQSMAGVGTAYSIPGTTNFVNPASLSDIRQTVYSLGMTFDFRTFDNGKKTIKVNDGFFDHMIMSVPLSAKTGIQFGVAPYSTTGYTVNSSDSVLVDGSFKGLLDHYAGNGGLTMAYIALGQQVFKNFSVGVNAAYLFGSIERSTYNYVEDRLLQTKIMYSDWVRGVKLRFGLNYNFPIKNDIRAYLGATYEFSVGMKNDRSYMLYTVVNYDDEFDPDDPQNTKVDATHSFSLPSVLTVGLGVGDVKRWYVGLEGEYTECPDWTGVDFARTDATFQSSMRVAIGGSYQPNFNTKNTYSSRIKYKAGAYYSNNTFKVRNQEVTDMGATLGISLPMTKIETQTMALSNFNIYLNVGSMGKQRNGMIREMYYKLGLSVSLNDRWFLKQKFY